VESRHKLPGPSSSLGGPGPNSIVYVFMCLGSVIIRQVYKLALSDAAQVTLQLRVSLSNLVSRFWSSPTLLGGAFFPLGPNPLSAVLFSFVWALAVRNYVLSYCDSGLFTCQTRLRTCLRTHKVLGMRRMSGRHRRTLNCRPPVSQLKEHLKVKQFHYRSGQSLLVPGV
jgi:hypothetical protein